MLGAPQAKRFERAIKRYGRALEALESDHSFSADEKDRAKVRSPLLLPQGLLGLGRSLSRFSHSSHCSLLPSDGDRPQKLKVPLNVNMAACHLKLCQWSDVKATCGKALEMESGNVKALFRRAQVRACVSV